jgi:hypothetical protein
VAAALLLFARELSAVAPPGPETVAALVAKAGVSRLAEAPYWHVLLHYERGVFGLRSLIDDPAFFAAPDGKWEPQAEIEATIRALCAPAEAGKPHAADLFPARLEWLAEQLGLDREELPVPRCVEVERVLERIRPEGVSCIFPSAYMNSPASLFGHTLLCVRSQFDSKLLDHAINYAADSNETNGLLFAFKGIFGLYPGRYAAVPYYAKVQQYNDIDQRDIWEYRLNLTPPEVRRLMLHLWEVRSALSQYFFFDENCSYNLLYLLDAARPGLDLHGDARGWVIPLDTVRLMRDAGLIEESTYRPSRATQLHTLAAPLSPAQLDLAQAVTRGEQPAEAVLGASWPEEEQARALEVATEELRLRYNRKQVPQPVYAKRYLQILGARSQVDATPVADSATPSPPPPDFGHRSMRLSLGAGSEDGREYAEFGWRPAYHDELDPGLGYLPGSQIDFMGLVLRRYGGEDSPDLQRLDAVRVQSLSPRGRFFRPISWKADLGLRRDPLDDDDDALIASGTAAAGATWQLPAETLAYVLPEVELQGGNIDCGWAVGGGVMAGVYQQLTDRCRLQLACRALYFVAGDRHPDVDTWLAQRWRVTANQAVSLRVGLHRVRGDHQPGASLAWHWYF